MAAKVLTKTRPIIGTRVHPEAERRTAIVSALVTLIGKIAVSPEADPRRASTLWAIVARQVNDASRSAIWPSNEAMSSQEVSCTVLDAKILACTTRRWSSNFG